MEPTSSAGAAAGAAGWKLIGGAAGAMGIGAALASIVVLCMTKPKTDAEWIVGIITTVVGSIAGGAFAIIKLDMLHSLQAASDDVTLFMALCTGLGFAFSCGLPAWAVVRGVFAYIRMQEGKTILETASDIKQKIGG